MIRSKLFLLLPLLLSASLVATGLPQNPANDKPYVDPNAYADACYGSWPNDTRCRTACLQAASCASDDHGACANAVLNDCDQKRSAAEKLENTVAPDLAVPAASGVKK